MPAKQLEDLIQFMEHYGTSVLHVQAVPKGLSWAKPKDTQMRDVIDQVALRELEPVFEDYFRVLQRGKPLT